MRILKIIAVVLLLMVMTVFIYRSYFYINPTMVYRFKDQTESHCFIVYNDNSAEEMKESSNVMYYNVPVNRKINVYRTSSDVSKRSLPFGFINVDTDSIIVGYHEFIEYGIYFVKDTVIVKSEDQPLGIFSFYMGNQMNEVIEKRHFEIHDSLVNAISQ